jgi:hypothetical protein
MDSHWNLKLFRFQPVGFPIIRSNQNESFVEALFKLKISFIWLQLLSVGGTKKERECERKRAHSLCFLKTHTHSVCLAVVQSFGLLQPCSFFEFFRIAVTYYFYFFECNMNVIQFFGCQCYTYCTDIFFETV